MDAGIAHARDRRLAPRRDPGDVLAAQFIDVAPRRLDRSETRAIDRLERNEPTHRLVGEPGDALGDGRAALSREPVDALDSRDGRIDVEHDARECGWAHSVLWRERVKRSITVLT